MKKALTLIAILCMAALLFVGCNLLPTTPTEPSTPTEPTVEPTEPPHTHTPDEDDGDCTTDILCTECGEVAVPGAENHTPAADDGDCTTDITCTVCGKVTTEGAEAHTPAADDGDCTTDITCTVCGKVTTEGAEAHTPNADDGDCTTAITCSVCGKETTAAKDHTPNADDGDCTTAITCSVCGKETTPAATGHTPNADDGDCTTAITCSVCGKVTAEGNETHSFGTNEPACTVCGTANPDYVPPVKIVDFKLSAEWVDSKITWQSVHPTKSFDGDPATRWNPQVKPGYAGEPSIEYILNRAADINKITVTVSSTTKYYFDVYTSTDNGATYTLLAKICTANEANAYSGAVCTLDGLKLEGVTNVKLTLTGGGSEFVNIYEVTVSEEGSEGLDNSWMIPEEPKEEVKATVSVHEYISNGVAGTDGFSAVGSANPAYDGSTTSKWNPCLKNYTSDTGIIFHLDKKYDLTKLVLTFSNPHFYDIYVSSDHETYTELAKITSETQYDETGAVCTLDGLDAADIQYVKIIFTGRAPSNSLWINFFEIEIYGTV